MKNEVIIDGCNVIECEFYDDLECNAYRQEYWEPQDNTKDLCKEHPNCYFKQLQRVKSENEKLKRQINMHLTTFDKCCANGLIMSNNMSEALNE